MVRLLARDVQVLEELDGHASELRESERFSCCMAGDSLR
jgi:hypothetical protein